MSRDFRFGACSWLRYMRPCLVMFMFDRSRLVSNGSYIFDKWYSP